MAARQGIDRRIVSQLKQMRAAMEPWLMVGDTFGTRYEQQCTVATAPDEAGDFEASGDDGILASYHVDMVTWVKRPVDDVCADSCPRCDLNLKREGYPRFHQHSGTGVECSYSWAG